MDIIKHIYGHFFKYIIYCGKNIISIMNANVNSFDKFQSYAFVDYDPQYGFYHHMCMSKVIEMKLQIGWYTFNE